MNQLQEETGEGPQKDSIFGGCDVILGTDEKANACLMAVAAVAEKISASLEP